MATCPQCGKEYPDTVVDCPDCAAPPAQFGPEHDLSLVSVYRANDEMSAHLIHGALTNNAVPAYIHSEQAPMFGTILQLDHGCWGEVMVPEAYREAALEIVKAFTTEDPQVEAEAEREAMSASPEDPSVVPDETAEAPAPAEAPSTPSGTSTGAQPGP